MRNNCVLAFAMAGSKGSILDVEGWESMWAFALFDRITGAPAVAVAL